MAQGGPEAAAHLLARELELVGPGEALGRPGLLPLVLGVVHGQGAQVGAAGLHPAVEGDAGITNLVFTVTLSSVSDQIVTVGYESEPGGGVSGASRIADYASVDYTLVFQPGETVKFIEVPIVGDYIDELDETFKVKLGDPWNAEVDPANAEGTGTIIDDDDASAAFERPIARALDRVANLVDFD